MKATKGKFIVIDGGDGTGKGTQTKKIIERLESEGYKIKSADFPQYGKKSAGLVEEYLNGKYGSAQEVGPYIASMFYAVDRYDASFEIRKWIEEGYLIISNRYVTANMGHQGAKIQDEQKRLDYFNWIKEIEYELFKIPKPDLNIILSCPSEISSKLVEKKGHRDYIGGVGKDIHEADDLHLKQAEQTYLQLAKILPNTTLINCAPNNELLSIDHVHEIIYPLIIDLLNK